MQTRRTTVRDVRRANRASLLTDLFHGGRQSRQQLGDTTALSQASVSNLTSEMLDEGLVEEAGLVGSDGGRPRALLRVAPGFGYVVGADVGETRVLVELYDLAMSRLAVRAYRLGDGARDPARAVDRLLTGLSEVCDEAGVADSRLLGFGVGVPGVVDQGDGDAVVWSQTTGWDGVELGAMLRAGTAAPVWVENGVQAVGRAEMWFGAGRGARHAVIAVVGTGVGAAVVMDGHGYRGANSNAGEWGHTTLVFDGEPCRCGARGCLEAYIGGETVNRLLSGATGQPYDRALLARLLAAGTLSGEAADVVSRTVRYLGAGIGALVNLFSPERIVLGGPLGLALGEHFLPDIRAAAARSALRHPYAKTSIDLGRLGPDAVALGAATRPVARLLADGGLPAASVTAPAVPSRPRRHRGRAAS
ncbi:ROK family protein [Mangrovihabitans endophyticus]|uniref:Sugar kinase n=1 Tax=Mangrovihabitans endophyticus TaxID=1751298 RepID=A0A8J3BYH4_9ACTN|nr:ROK family protein [Mangrovihabitans endophyticus]GGK84545.1 sugar kinase [Mangrovihabitans endophyticus]